MIVELPFALEPGRRADIHGLTHVLQSIDCEGRQAWRRAGGTEIFQMPDPRTGFPMRPGAADTLRLMAEGDMELHAADLADETAQARRQGGMHRAEAMALDPMSALRERFLERYHGGPCNLSDAALRRFWNAFIDDDAVAKALACEAPRAKGRAGRKSPWTPCGKTLRDWIATRGDADGRQLRDCVSNSGRVPRRKTVRHPVEILSHHVALCHAGRRDAKKSYYLYKAEIGRINRGEVTGRFDDVGEPIAYPQPSTPYVAKSYWTFWRLAKKTRSEAAKLAKSGRKAAEMDHGGGGRMERAEFFGDIVGIDDSPVPVLAKIEVEGLVWVGRPTLTIARDRFVGGFVGSDLSWDHPSSSTILRTILDVGTPKRVPTDMAAEHPQLAMFCCAPSRASIDNLVSHHHAHVEDSLREIACDVDFTGNGKPRDKPDVERGVGVVLDWAFKCGPGAVDPIPLRRRNDDDPPADQLPTLSDLRLTLDRAIAVLNCSGTKANMGRSPLGKLRTSMNTRKPGIIADRPRFRKAIGMVVYDVEFRASGLELSGLRYSESKATREMFDRLCHLVRPSKRTVVDTVKVKVKFDPGDLGRLHVWDPVLKDWVTLECDQPEYADRLPKFVHDQILADIAADEVTVVSPATLIEYRTRLFSKAMEVNQEASAKERRSAARLATTPLFRMHLGGYVEAVDEDDLDGTVDWSRYAPIGTTSGHLVDADRPTPRSAPGIPSAPQPRRSQAESAQATARARIDRDRRDAGRDPHARPARPKSAANRGLRAAS